MIKQMDFLGLVVDDIKTATEFYADTLGFPINDQASDPAHYTQFDLSGGAIFALMQGTPEQISQNFDPAIQVDDVDGTYKRLQQSGVELLGEPHDLPFGRTFLLRTPDGHILRMYSPIGQN